MNTHETRTERVIKTYESLAHRVFKTQETPSQRIIKLFLYFTVYSFLGWCMETIYYSVMSMKLVDRGFLMGPFCPIYGCGMLLIIVFLKPIKHKPFIFFLYSTIVLTVLEFFTSLLMEFIFHASWWNYFDQPFNLDGRICLSTSILWGLLATIVVYVIQPHLKSFIRGLPMKFKTILTHFLFAYFIIDTAVSTVINLFV